MLGVLLSLSVKKLSCLPREGNPESRFPVCYSLSHGSVRGNKHKHWWQAGCCGFQPPAALSGFSKAWLHHLPDISKT